jgi:hypothetical protein
MKTGPCSDILFVEDDIWKWRMPDEYSVLAYYNGNAEEAYKTTNIIVNSPVFKTISQGEQERVMKNMDFYTKALNPQSQTENVPEKEVQEI